MNELWEQESGKQPFDALEAARAWMTWFVQRDNEEQRHTEYRPRLEPCNSLGILRSRSLCPCGSLLLERSRPRYCLALVRTVSSRLAHAVVAAS
jgi:hypothetical protein